MVKTKLIASHRRLFKNIFVCKRCSQKLRTDPIRVVQKLAVCRRCNSRAFRPVRSKKK